MTYAAAWQKQQTDPAVGTDLATSLFYSGNIDAALKQVNAVIKAVPGLPGRVLQPGQLPASPGAASPRQGRGAEVHRQARRRPRPSPWTRL